MLHVGCHWVTISTVGCGANEVDVVDGGLPTLIGLLKLHIAVLLCNKKDAITLRYVTLHAVMPV